MKSIIIEEAYPLSELAVEILWVSLRSPLGLKK